MRTGSSTAKIICLILAALCAVLVLSSCGETDAPKTDDIKGETEEFKNLSVFVPEGMTLVAANAVNDSSGGDIKTMVMSSDENEDHYFFMMLTNKENAENSIAGSRTANDGVKDITVKAGGREWTGIAYKYENLDCFQLYGMFGETAFLISGVYFAYDNPLTNKVLSSITVK